MSYYKHHAILVHSHSDELIKKAHIQALDCFQAVTPISNITQNEYGYSTFMIAPDGSKERWEHSELGDRTREKYLNWLKEQHYSDGSTSLDYIEISFAEEENRPARILCDSNRNAQAIKLRSTTYIP